MDIMRPNEDNILYIVLIKALQRVLYKVMQKIQGCLVSLEELLSLYLVSHFQYIHK